MVVRRQWRWNVWQTGRWFGNLQSRFEIWPLLVAHRDPLAHQPFDAIVEREVAVVCVLDELSSIRDVLSCRAISVTKGRARLRKSLFLMRMTHCLLSRNLDNLNPQCFLLREATPPYGIPTWTTCICNYHLEGWPVRWIVERAVLPPKSFQHSNYGLV